jgi:exopolysaccharide production protein ExoQ
MPPQLMLWLGIGFAFWLFRLDRAWRRLPSAALWIPGIWLAMASSRQMSFWLGSVGLVGGGTSNLEGSPVNVIFNGSLFLITLVVLYRRGFSWGEFTAANKALVSIFAFFLCSALWSPFPLPTVKRLIQEFGCVLTGLIILTERDPGESLRVLFVRVSYILFPLSVIFIRYIPSIGRVVSSVSGTHMLCGVADHKNSLGQVTMVFCLVLLWDMMETRKEALTPQTTPERWARPVNMGIGLYLLVISNSGTSLMCFLLGIVLLFGGKLLARRENARQLFMVSVISIVCLLIINQEFGIASRISEAMGRGAGLTGRTDIWNKILEKNSNYLIGSGFRGFWETSEGESVWRELGTNPLLTAHNGYLETYLNGGAVGLFLLTVFLLSTGLNAVSKLVKGDPIGRLAVVFWPILLIGNVTESQFIQVGPVWLTMLIVTIHCPWQNDYAGTVPEDWVSTYGDELDHTSGRSPA